MEHTRKVVQLHVEPVSDPKEGKFSYYGWCVCNDGTVWLSRNCSDHNTEWHEIPIPRKAIPAKDLIADKEELPLWRQNTEEGFAAYVEMAEQGFDALMNNWEWIAAKKEYFPGCNVKRTLQRMWEEYWGKKAGWDNKRNAARGKKDYDPEWESTIDRNFKRSICYYGNKEIDGEKQQLEQLNAKA